MAAPGAESVNEILHATVVEMLAVAGQMEATDDSLFFLNHIEGFAEIIATISALTDTDIDENVFTIFSDMVQQMRLQSETTETVNPGQPRGRTPFDLPAGTIEHYAFSGLKIHDIANLFGVSKRNIKRRMQQSVIR